MPLSFPWKKFNWKMHKSMRREEGALSGLKWHSTAQELSGNGGGNLVTPSRLLWLSCLFLPCLLQHQPPFLGSRHRGDRGVGLESIQVSHRDPKGNITIRFNEIREFSPRCPKTASNNACHLPGRRIPWRSPVAVSFSIPLHLLVAAEVS